MYVCNCNGITDSEVDEAVRSGAKKWDDVHAYFDCAPCCGKCECEITEAICKARTETSSKGKKKKGEPLFGTPALVPAV